MSGPRGPLATDRPAPAASAEAERARIRSLGDRVVDTLRPLLDGRERVALIEFPAYANVGDSAIFLGQLACLEALGLPAPCFVCDLLTYDGDVLDRRLGDSGVILLAGGGSFGDLWPLAQRCREDVVGRFRDTTILQLPQSIHFRDEGARDRARRIYASHPDLVFLARERQSLERAESELGIEARLCPDAAFCLGPLSRPDRPDVDVLWLARTDKESTGGERLPTSPGMEVADWIDERPTALLRLTRWLIEAVRRRPDSDLLRGLLVRCYAPLARQRLRRGCRLLARGRAVVTDRLHGHVLSLLMGIPHVLHDNSYGKVSSFHRTWTADSVLVTWADDPARAARLGRRVAADGAGPGRTR